MKKVIFYCLISLFFFGCNTANLVSNSSLFVGTYSGEPNEGIYSFSFNTETGELYNKALAAKLISPSFVKIAPNKKYLYAVEETSIYEDTDGGIVAFEIIGDSLKKINSARVAGSKSCHIGISSNGKDLAASSYFGGKVSIFKLGEKGEILSAPQYIDHAILDTTKVSHPHSAKFVDGQLFVADLGLDGVKKYSYVNNKFVPSKQESLNTATSAGPRHFTFGQKGKFLYVINELNSTITLFKEVGQGEYIEVETLTTLDKDFKGESFCADIHLSKDGNFLYGSNRGENTIVIFKVDAKTGKLNLVGRESVKGDWPRNFVIDPTNTFLLVANQKSNNITVFKRDVEKGTLSFLNETILLSPVCLEFLN